MAITLRHRVDLRAPGTHLVHVETTVQSDAPLPSPLTLFMPVWTPGSYLVREYSRHLEGLSVEGDASAIKIRKNAWRVDAKGARAVVVRYRVYCNELTVRTNHVDETHAFLNNAALLLAVEGHEGATSRVELETPNGWRVSTPLRSTGDGAYEAPDLDTLVDSPIEAGRHREEAFTVLGKPHRLAVWPPDAAADAELQRLVADTTSILETEANLLGGGLPYDAYLFLLHLSPRGRGGLEHRSSASLLASPMSFASRDGYLDLLSLVAHEALHVWNVKRIRPEGLVPYRYQEENYTRLLWWFEGATSYYDWRVLRLAKLCTVSEYLDHLAQEIAYVDATHGRLVHSLEDASFDAWIKLYRPDENSQNSTVSYYRKGEVVCALLDLEIRGRSGGRASLDQALRFLWENYGRAEKPVPEGGMQAILERACDVRVGDLLDAWVRAPGEIDFAPTLARVGLALERQPRDSAFGGGPAGSLGVRARQEAGRIVLASVVRDGAAARGGIDPGDEVLAIDGRRVEGSLEVGLAGKRAGDAIEVLVARDGRTLARKVTLDPPRLERVRLVPKDDAPAEARAAFAAWLGDPAKPMGPSSQRS